KRNLSDGALVSAFGTGGVVTSDPTANSDQILAIATTSTAIFIAGFDSISTTNSEWRVEKYDITTGAPVTAFGVDGVWKNDLSARLDKIRGITVDATDLYIVGDENITTTTDSKWRIEKHDITTGATTTAFNPTGSPAGVVFYNPSTVLDIPYAVKLDPTNANLFIAGAARSAAADIGWVVLKFGAGDGATTTAFSGDGILNDNNPSANTDEALAIDLNNTDIFVTGYDSVTSATNLKWRTTKYDITTGATTTAFGTSGVTTFDGTVGVAITTPGDQGRGVVLDGSNVYVAGFDNTGSGTAAGRGRVIKYDLTTGATSTAFNANGTVISEDGNDDRFHAVAVDDNYLYLAGYGSSMPGTANTQWIIEKREKSSGLLATTTFPAIIGPIATRDIDTTATTTNTWNIQSEDETTAMTHDYYALDDGASNSTAEEASSANINFAVTAPTDASITSIDFAGRYMSGAQGTANLSLRDYSGISSTIGGGVSEGGWNLVSTAAGTNATIAMLYFDPITMGGVLLGGMAGFLSDPQSHIDMIGNKMNFRLPTTVSSASTTNTTMMWDFAMPSIQWVESGTSTLSQAHYRWRADDGTESGASYIASEDSASTTPSVLKGDRIRLRMLLSNTGLGSARDQTLQLEFASSTCTSWTAVPNTETAGIEWTLDLSENLVNGTASTDLSGLTNPASKTFVAGRIKTSSNASNAYAITLSRTQFTEYEYGMRSTSAASLGVLYCFRLTNNGSTTNFSYGVTPQIILGGILRLQAGGSDIEGSGVGAMISGGSAPGGGNSEPGGTGDPVSGGTPGGGGGGDSG
ncbi:MAG: hypothetical protein Q7S75_01720, partial [bacterium]|nr:hypothetical protein [bacterium]